MIELDTALLDDPEALAAADPGGVLRTVAGSGAQVREAATLVAETDLGALADERPRAVLLSSVGSSAAACDVLGAMVGEVCPLPLIPVPGPELPRWAGPLDLVVAVSRSGTATPTLELVAEAGRRGCRLVTIGGATSPLARLSDSVRGIHVPADRETRHTRMSLWSIAVPLLAVADAVGVTSVPASVLEETADRLDDVAVTCRPASESFVNPAKALAMDIAGSLPLVWGSSGVAATAGRRFARQLAANAKYPAVAADLEEVAHGAAALLDGPFASGSSGDMFHDPDLDGPASMAPRVVIVRDGGESQQAAALRRAVSAVVADRGVRSSELGCDDGHPLLRLAHLVLLGDFASVYLALGTHVDPAPTPAVLQVKDRRGGFRE